MSPIFQEKKLRIKATLKYVVVLLLILMVTIVQDFFHSRDFDHSIYLAEKRLINSLWILILPVTIFWNVLFRKMPFLANIRVLLVKRLLFIFFATIFHLFLFAGLADFISKAFLELHLPFLINLRFAVSEELYKYFLIYSIIALLLVKNHKHVRAS
ncbi:hypothetical protein [Algoriphagus sp. NG3]|uniref:hypothetical protein n=1 Tax=Algoriphagus sp. NG3 TaxID=3097546 RepID=UPI002A8202F6|nr:hypothetical protein [Algoriphagus sp. NG3]WPR74931.1 hypothetical protein SLW71_19915 [Algoriphagus sp. NG3]